MYGLSLDHHWLTLLTLTMETNPGYQGLTMISGLISKY